MASASDKVASELRDRIVSGDLSLGAKLPNEGELGDLFGVSRLTAREALKALGSEGLIETKRGVNGGSFIVAPAPAHVADRLETSVGLLSAAEVLSVQDLLEARSMVEVPAARLAAERRTEDDVTQLRICVEEEVEVSSALDVRLAFHDRVVGASKNPLLSIMSRSVHQPLRTRFLRDKAGAAFWRDVHHDHGRIADAIAAGDADAAAAEMAAHLDRLRITYEVIDPVE
ncbi:FadR/GntR family transcriptional regulator [Euzebya tangerina]|uniref:FadR/GntR family transcriptional regulator n=1 Tax=Euzebya tangerina TaxID=591198 RepID=UPI0013C2D867|nr:FCD domain-containing protein [Euzebya tangerina]